MYKKNYSKPTILSAGMKRKTSLYSKKGAKLEPIKSKINKTTKKECLDALDSIDKSIKILEENKKIIDNLQLDIDKLSDLHKEL